MRFSALARWHALVPTAVFCIALALALTRAWTIRRIFENSGNCEVCLFWQAFSSDLAVIGCIGLLGALQLSARLRAIKLVVMSIQLLVLLILAIDVTVFRLLTVRLYLADIEKFGAEFGAIVGFLRLTFGAATLLMALGVLVVIGAVVASAFARDTRWRTASVLSIAAAVALGLSAIGSSAKFQFVIGDWVHNWFAMNLDQGVSRSYSKSFAESAQNFANVPETCVSGTGSRKNVVLVIVESLSSYHSTALGGRGWTPELDRIASNGRLFTNFHANGFTTDMGLIALFNGKAPLPAVGRYGGSRAYDGYFGPKGTLPTLLAANGYDTAFLTTGDLRFLEKGAWVRSIGFGHAEGDDHPFYKGMPRMHFHAAPDAALFDRFNQWRASRARERPYFAALLTVSSHPPFLAPDGTRGEEASIRYADSALGRFYDTLVASRFFDDGVLIVLGDHRAMTMVTAEERARHGERALSRVPLLVVTDPRAAGTRIGSLQQQADLPYAIAAFTGERVCRPEDRGDFLADPPVEARTVIHVRGDQRSWLGIYSANGADSKIRLDGDDTSWIGSPPSNGAEVLGWVNKERIALGEVDRDMIDFMLRVHGGR